MNIHTVLSKLADRAVPSIILLLLVSCGAPRFYYESSPDQLEVDGLNVNFHVFSVNNHGETGANKKDSTFNFDIRVFGADEQDKVEIDFDIANVRVLYSKDSSTIIIGEKNKYVVDRRDLSCSGIEFGPFTLPRPLPAQLVFVVDLRIRNSFTNRYIVDQPIEIKASLSSYKVGTVRDFLRGK